MTDTLDRADPVTVFYDHGAEQVVLGSMLSDPQTIGEVEAIVSAGSFHKPCHPILFKAITELREGNRLTDPHSVAGFLADEKLLNRIPGGVTYLQELLAAPVTATAAEATNFARVVADKALLRDFDAGLERARSEIRTGGSASPAELLERTRVMISDLGMRAAGDGGPTRWRDIIRPGLDAIELAAEEGSGPPGVPTGIPDLDRLIHGLQKQRLYVVAGIPGGGKSTLGAGDFVRSAAFEHSHSTAVFSMEMTEQELFNRLICAASRVPSQRVVDGTLDTDDWTAIARVCGETENAPLWIDDTKGLTMADIRVRARRLKQQHGLELVVIDYLGLIESATSAPRNQQIDEMARSAKNLAGELDLAVVLLAQMNRAYAQRADKRPVLTDLKESGGIEAHADVVIFVHRDEQFDKTKRLGEADLIVEKNRGGARGTVEVAAQLHLNRFVSMAMP
ncbi:replicative DNA helicase [Micromonospora sp. NPDC053740]|uniref:replicative DNA helicase n=1 Tax=Micromonospora sp. NPDC053740 TaxID=3155173 RepID=UPI003446E161